VSTTINLDGSVVGTATADLGAWGSVQPSDPA